MHPSRGRSAWRSEGRDVENPVAGVVDVDELLRLFSDVVVSHVDAWRADYDVALALDGLAGEQHGMAELIGVAVESRLLFGVFFVFFADVLGDGENLDQAPHHPYVDGGEVDPDQNFAVGREAGVFRSRLVVVVVTAAALTFAFAFAFAFALALAFSSVPGVGHAARAVDWASSSSTCVVGTDDVVFVPGQGEGLDEGLVAQLDGLDPERNVAVVAQHHDATGRVTEVERAELEELR